MTEGKYVLERPSPFRSLVVALAIGAAAIVAIDYLFSGTAVFLGFIVAAIAIYIFVRR